ncbi:hypothetical protein CDD83_1606 [Cordyceps sp. RAO-2017]|nr:hypothetical protein CDD83_1606 [Cordyceps sp. RAO-2017]
MDAQYAHKFLPDADGNSFSARFRGFMRSSSLPLKATIYAEWHDDRLAPWLHFVPLDNTFRDLYAVLDYFADGAGGPGDADARFIAEQGQAWANRVLRRDDMRLYVWRLLLEWARLCDDNRHSLAFVDDLAAR